jgi:hypothetical protein
MFKRTVLSTVVLAALAIILPGSASAQRTWVSGVGDDANPCSRTAPCKTFAGAISKTGAGGEIDVLDPGGFGAVTITKAITIAAEGSGEGGVLVGGTNGIVVNCGLDPNCVVVLRGLQIDGIPSGPVGVKFVAGGALEIQNCTIRNFTGPSPNGYGVLFAPSASASLLVTDTTITTNGVPATSGGGITVQPTGNGTVKASLARVNVTRSTAGVRADGSAATGGTISVSVTETVAADNSNSGFVVVGGGAGGNTVTMDIDHSTSANNGVGLNVSGTGATLRIGSSTVISNATGVKITAPGVMTSYGNNQIDDNPIPGPAIPTNTNPLK